MIQVISKSSQVKFYFYSTFTTAIADQSAEQYEEKQNQYTTREYTSMYRKTIEK